MENKLKWVEEASKYIGQKEMPGKDTAPFITKWLIWLKAWWSDDETPWCGVAMGAWMKACGIPYPKEYYRAKSWLNWGVRLSRPAYGCVVVFERQGGGHVGILVGKDADGRLMVLGGNQADSVSVAPFRISRVAGYRWPAGQGQAWAADVLPLYVTNMESSKNES